MLDMDLAILGAPEARYDEYAKQIRTEYRIYPDEMYASGRKAVLHSFIQKERLYFTEEMSELLGEHARENMRRELGSL